MARERSDPARAAVQSLPAYAHSTLIILALCIVLILSVAYLTLWERKLIGWMQMRRGPNRVRLFGIPHTEYIGQPFADVVKLLIKEVVVPARSNRILFRLAPALTLIPALAAWAVIPLAPGYAIADVDAGVLYYLSLTSVGVYGVILAGWASNSKYGLSRRHAPRPRRSWPMRSPWLRARRRPDGGGQPEPRCHRGAPAGRAASLEPVLAVPAVHGVFHLRRRGDQSRAL